jgi:hypothetical protein
MVSAVKFKRLRTSGFVNASATTSTPSRNYADAADRTLRYYESPGAADANAEVLLQKDFETAARALQRQDRDFIQTLLDAAPADQRDAIRERVREYEERLQDSANAAP